MNATQAAELFAVDGRLVSVSETGSGNINDTYMAVFRTTFDEHRFILQRINRRVFQDPSLIMRNLRTVTEHVHPRLEMEANEADRIWQLPRIILTRDGNDYLSENGGNCWRAISLIASARAYDRIQGLDHAHEAGIVLGHFQWLLSDLDSASLAHPLPEFHDMAHYLNAYDKALASQNGGQRLQRMVEARRCRDFIAQRRAWSQVLIHARERGELPVRVVHGDPKISNIMVDDATGKGTCIVDLDTIMPGLIHFDFGDCLRSGCNPAGEETTELRDVVFDLDLCKAICTGYARHACRFLTRAEAHYLYDAIRLLAFELGLRFFTDFLAGDVYFKTRYDGHNLNRARVQFRLVESIENREPQIREILNDTIGRCFENRGR